MRPNHRIAFRIPKEVRMAGLQWSDHIHLSIGYTVDSYRIIHFGLFEPWLTLAQNTRQITNDLTARKIVLECSCAMWAVENFRDSTGKRSISKTFRNTWHCLMNLKRLVSYTKKNRFSRWGTCGDSEESGESGITNLWCHRVRTTSVECIRWIVG